VCQNLLFEKGCNFRLLLSSFRETKHERTVAAVESLDQKVELDQVEGEFKRLINAITNDENLRSHAATNHAIVD